MQDIADNTEQAEYWNSDFGRKWITYETVMDAALAPTMERVLELARPGVGEKVLDIGCGTGALTVAAREMAHGGRITGADISEPMLERARIRHADVSGVDWLHCDAQTYAFPVGHYDCIISRFGVMFFADPVAAFANLRRALRTGGRMVFACWGDPARIPWFSIPVGIAVQRVGPPPDSKPTDPGPTAFRDAERVVEILMEAGYGEVSYRTEPVAVTPPGTVEKVGDLAARLGPAARILAHHEGTEEDTRAVAGEIARSLAEYDTRSGISIPCEAHFFMARN